MAAFGQHRLVKQDLGQIVEMLARFELAHQGMLGVDFERRQ